MGVYIIRHIETKEFQGVFWGSLAEVWDCFDEMGDPYGFEYASIPPGGFMCEAKVGNGVLIEQWQDMLPDGGEVEDEEDEAKFAIPWDRFIESSSFWNALRCQDRLRWKPMPSADEVYGMRSSGIAR